MTVSHGVEGQLISEARICIYSDIKALSHPWEFPKFNEPLGLKRTCTGHRILRKER